MTALKHFSDSSFFPRNLQPHLLPPCLLIFLHIQLWVIFLSWKSATAAFHGWIIDSILSFTSIQLSFTLSPAVWLYGAAGWEGEVERGRVPTGEEEHPNCGSQWGSVCPVLGRRCLAPGLLQRRPGEGDCFLQHKHYGWGSICSYMLKFNWKRPLGSKMRLSPSNEKMKRDIYVKKVWFYTFTGCKNTQQ